MPRTLHGSRHIPRPRAENYAAIIAQKLFVLSPLHILLDQNENLNEKVRHRDFRSVFVQSSYETATRFLIYLQSCNSKVPLFPVNC